MCIRDSLQSAMFLINSRSHLVSSTTISLKSKSHHQWWRTFSRSYGTILPSSFTIVLSNTLVFSTYPPVSVWGTVSYNLKLRGFSWKHGIDYFPLKEWSLSVLDLKRFRIYLESQSTTLNTDNRRRASLTFSVTPSQL